MDGLDLARMVHACTCTAIPFFQSSISTRANFIEIPVSLSSPSRPMRYFWQRQLGFSFSFLPFARLNKTLRSLPLSLSPSLMATTAEAGASPYEGGVGGKFRSRRPNRGRPSTPYDRPPIAIQNPNGRNGWISKLVDPASRIITTSAAKLFSSVFRKRLTAPPSDVNLEPRHEPPKENLSSGVEERSSKEGENPSNSHDSTGIDELEQLLQQKTFTRVEFNHLTELLRSRTVDLSADVENRSTEPFTSQLVVTHKRQEKEAMPGQENGEGSMFFASISTPAVGLSAVKQVPEEDASPTELAKAYMGSRPSKVSPSTLGLWSQTFREDPTSLDIVPFAAKSPSMSFMPRSAGRYSGVRGLSETCYITPRQRGRSAMYSASRTPYSGVRSAATVKGIVPTDAGPSTSSHWTQANSTLSGAKQVLKRSSSVLDNDFGSGGPMRRIRQRYNMISPPKDQVSISSIQKPLLLDRRNYNTSNPLAIGNGDNRISNATFPAVPPQSSEMARKILQQLDKLVPSPKEKSSELKVAMVRDKSPTKLTLNMLNGRALRSMEDIESPKLQNLLGNDTPNVTPNVLNGTCLLDSNHSTSQKQDMVRENGPVKVADVGAKLASEVDAVKNVVLPVKGIGSGEKPADSVVSGFDANTRQVKRAFQMSAPDDYVDLDDDSCSGKDASVPRPAEEEKPQPSVVEHRAVVVETVTVEKPKVPTAESKPLASFTSSNGIARTAGASDVPVINVKDDAPTFPKTPESITLSPPAPIPTAQSPSLFNGTVPLKHETTAPVFSFGSKTADKVPTVFAFSSTTSSFSNASGLKSDAKLDSKSEMLSSNSTAVEASPKATGAEKGDKTQKDGDLHGSLQNPISSVVSTSTTSAIFSFGASTNSSPSNGSTSVSVAPPAPIFGSSSLSPISSSSGTTTTSSSIISPSVSAASPTFSMGPPFLFGSGTKEAVAVVPSNPVSQLSMTSGLESTDSEPKVKKASPFNMIAPLSTSSSPAFTMTGNGIFGFNASTTSSTANPSSASSQSQSSNSFGTASAGSLFGTTQATPAVSSIMPFTHSALSQSGSSTSSPTFGLSGSSAFSFGSSPFGSSAPGAKLFGSGSGFGLGSSTSLSTGGGSFSSSSGSFAPSATASSLLGSSSQSATPSIFGSGFGSTSSSPAAGFSFGASAAAAAPTSGGSTALTFGSSFGASSASMFSFNSAAPAAVNSSSSFAPSQPVFGALNPVVGFGSASPGNDQMNEDSMAEDTVQALSSMPVAPPVFGQPVANSPPPSNFNFGSPASVPSAGVFQFGGGHQNPTPQMTSPQFQATGNLHGGSFSLGAGGGDKANRRIVRVRRDKPKKK